MGLITYTLFGTLLAGITLAVVALRGSLRWYDQSPDMRNRT